ncbi:hypothetical protein BX616_002956 [Lobosporangium transversale]|nr:hypothetical protein BX616_002956 [Lobosporangium transversale]
MMMVGHNITNYSQTLPQPPLSPPPPYTKHPIQRPYQTSQSDYQKTSSFPLPNPESIGRLPVRMGLSDPRIGHYLKPSKSTSASATLPALEHTTHTLSSPLQDHVPSRPSPQLSAGYLHGTVPARSYWPGSTYNNSNSSHRPTSPQVPNKFNKLMADDTGQLSIRRDFELYDSPNPNTSPQSRQSYDKHPAARGHNHENHSNHPKVCHGAAHGHSTVVRSSADSLATRSSSSPSPLPSPAPTVSLSPDLHLTCNNKTQHRPHTTSQNNIQHPHDLLSPSSSEADIGADSKTILSPLFPSSPPAVFSSIPQYGGTHLSSRPSSACSAPIYMTASLSGSSNSSTVSRPYDSAAGNRPMSPPSLAPWTSNKNQTSYAHSHPHKLPPSRAPERSGQEVMRTSSLDTESSEYINLDYYTIYRQNPRLLRPEGGRYDEKRHHEASSENQHHDEEEGHATMQGKARFRGSAGESSSTGVSRRQSMPLILTATGRVLRHEDAKQGSTSDVARNFGIYSSPSSKPKSTFSNRSISEGLGSSSSGSSSRPAAMSISHLLTDDSSIDTDTDLKHFYRDWSENNDSDIGTNFKRQRTDSTSVVSQDNDTEPIKRTRMSKKRAAELGLLDADGNIISNRKRTKKSHGGDHVSSSGFTHGGERVVQEPEELVILEPDVGPISMLDVKTPPAVHWKGQPLSITDKPGIEYLHPHEAKIASILRLSPAQYLNCKQTIILASRDYFAVPNGKPFRKSDAQKMCRIDVNKTSRLWEFFAKVGWLQGISAKDV